MVEMKQGDENILLFFIYLCELNLKKLFP